MKPVTAKWAGCTLQVSPIQHDPLTSCGMSAAGSKVGTTLVSATWYLARTLVDSVSASLQSNCLPSGVYQPTKFQPSLLGASGTALQAANDLPQVTS